MARRNRKTNKPKNRKLAKVDNSSPQEPVHPWRLCPVGEHYRNAAQVAPYTKKDGTFVHGHSREETCAKNPSGKDQLYPAEIKEISEKYFSKAENKPCALSLGFENGSKFDELIAGWVKYWNEVLQPDLPLEPNVVKALIASESGFNPKRLADKKNSNSARGLMQITNETRKILGDNSGELKDHYVNVTKEELNDASVNICAGVRWLFQKRLLASSVRLKRKATWVETAEEYKGDLKGLLNKNAKSQKDVDPFLKYLKEVEKCGK